MHGVRLFLHSFAIFLYFMSSYNKLFSSVQSIGSLKKINMTKYNHIEVSRLSVV